MKAVDLSGRIFGRLTVDCYTGRVAKNKHRLWQCTCSCGVTTIVSGSSLTSGNTRSCGCLHRDTITEHGASTRNRITSDFRRWQAMISRCRNPLSPTYHRYGGRGITVCDRWVSSFTNFANDMGPCPDGKSLDRIDNNAGYSPENCRWADRFQQAQNTRLNHDICFKGETHCLSEWARRIGVPYSRLRKRIESGWPIDLAMTKGRMKSKHG